MKFRKFLKTVPMKLYLIVLALILFAFFSNDFGLVDIQKTAVILAVGIDKTEEGYKLTSQVAVPKGNDRTTGGTSTVEIETEGETISDCIANLSSKTGWVPKLVFCNLILLGEEVVQEDVFNAINYFIRSEYMSDSCLMAVCEGKASEMISSKSAISDASSMAITQLFSDAAEKTGRVMTNTLKDFTLGYYGVSKSSFMPYVSMADQEGAQSSCESGGGGSGRSGGEKQKIYSAKQTAIFQDGKLAALLSEEETLAFSLLEGKMFAGTFDAEEKGETVTLTVLKNGGKVSLEVKDSPKVNFSLKVMVRLCCRGTTAPMEDVEGDEVPEEARQDAEEVLTGYLQSLWDTCKEHECDLFNLKRSLYRSSLKKYGQWKDALLSVVEPQFEVKLQCMK